MLIKKLPYWNKAINDLKRKDKILAKIILNHQKEYLQIRDKYFISLIKTPPASSSIHGTGCSEDC